MKERTGRLYKAVRDNQDKGKNDFGDEDGAAAPEENPPVPKMSPKEAFDQSLKDAGINERVKVVKTRTKKAHYHVEMEVRKNFQFDSKLFVIFLKQFFWASFPLPSLNFFKIILQNKCPLVWMDFFKILFENFANSAFFSKYYFFVKVCPNFFTQISFSNFATSIF